MESIENSTNTKSIILLQTKAKTILLNILRTIINDESLFDSEEKIDPKEIIIDVFSTSDKGSLGNLYYSIFIQNSTFNPLRDKNINLTKYKQINSMIFNLKDECNLPVSKSSMNVLLNFIPYLHKRIQLDFSLFKFYFHNGKITNRFILQPQINSSQKYIFIYINDIENNIKKNQLTDIVNTLTKMKIIWNTFSYVYIIIPANSESHMKKIFTILPEEIVPNNKINKNISTVFLIEDESEEQYINIFKNKYSLIKNDYYFILNNKNNILEIKNLSTILENLKKTVYIIDSYHNDPIQSLKNEKSILKEKSKNIFLYVLNFLNNIKSMNYLFNFSYNFQISISLNKNLDDFSLLKAKKIKVGGNLRTKDFLEFQKIFTETKIPNFQFDIKEIPTIDIEINFDTEIFCKICNTIILKNTDHYYCYICKDNYCFKCVKNNFEKNQNKNKFIDNKHNLLFFKTNNKNSFINIDKKKLGKNLFAEENATKFKDYHSACCDGCSGGFFNSPRFICLNCRPGIYNIGGYNDYCIACIEHMMKNDDIGKNILDKEEIISCGVFEKTHKLINKHNHEEHVYLMVALERSDCKYEVY